MQAAQRNQPAILLIEDDRTIRDLLDEYLSGEGYAVTTATDVAAALDALISRSFALIVTDALAEQRPPAERWGPLEAIHRAAGGVPIIICTAHNVSAYAEYAARGFRALLAKPFDLESLLALVEHTITSEAQGGMGMQQDEL